MPYFLTVLACIVGTVLATPKPDPQLGQWLQESIRRGTQLATGGLQLGNNAVQLVTDMKTNMVNTGTDGARRTLNAITSSASDGLLRATDMIGQRLDAVSSIPLIGSNLYPFTNMAKSGLNIVNNLGQSGLRLVNEIGSNGLAMMNAANERKMNAISNLADTGFKFGQSTLQNGANILVRLFSGMSNGGNSNTLGRVQALSTGLITGINRIRSRISSLLTGQGAQLLGQFQERLEIITQMLGSLRDSDSVQRVQQILTTGMRKMQNIAREIQSLIQDPTGGPITEQVTAIIGELGEAIGGQRGEQIMSNIGNHLGNAMNELGAIGSPLNEIANTANGITNSLGNAASEIGTVIGEQINRPVHEMMNNVGERTENVLGQLGANLGGENGQKIMQGVGETVNNVLSQLGSLAGSGTLQNVASNAANIASDIGAQASNAIGETQSIISNASANDIVSLVSSNLPQLSQVGSLLGSFLG